MLDQLPSSSTLAFAIGPVRRGETVTGHITAQHIGAMGAGAHADDAVLRCAALSNIFGGGFGRYIHAVAKARMIETLLCCETLSVAIGGTRKPDAR